MARAQRVKAVENMEAPDGRRNRRVL